MPTIPKPYGLEAATLGFLHLRQRFLDFCTDTLNQLPALAVFSPQHSIRLGGISEFHRG